MLSYNLQHFQTILNKRKFIDSWFWDRYGINPYQGCQFGCIYCDACRKNVSQYPKAVGSIAKIQISCSHHHQIHPGVGGCRNTGRDRARYLGGGIYDHHHHRSFPCAFFGAPGLPARSTLSGPGDPQVSALNYRIAERWLNRAYDQHLEGIDSKNLYWAGMNLQNLTESVAELSARGEIPRIRNITAELAREIEEELEAPKSE